MLERGEIVIAAVPAIAVRMVNPARLEGSRAVLRIPVAFEQRFRKYLIACSENI